MPKRLSCARIRGRNSSNFLSRAPLTNPYSHSLLRRCPTSRDFVPWRFLDAGQLSVRSLFLAGVQKPCMGPWKSSREFTACDFFLQLNFFVRLESPFLRPDPQCPNAVARRVCQGWPSLRYLLMLSAMPGQTLTNPSTAARSLWSDGRVEGSSLVAHEHSCRNLVFGGAATTPDHDAVLRIGSESSEAADPFCTTA